MTAKTAKILAYKWNSQLKLIAYELRIDKVGLDHCEHKMKMTTDGFRGFNRDRCEHCHRCIDWFSVNEI